MGRKQSDATKAKISEGMKASHARRRERREFEASPTAQRVKSLSESFAIGHPDGIGPSTVRNFGGLGRDVKTIIPEKKADPGLKKHEERVQAAQTTAEALGLRRASGARTPKEGESGGVVKAPMSPTDTNSKR